MTTSLRRRKQPGAIPLAVAAAFGGALIAGFGPELWKWVFASKAPIEYAIKVYSSAASNPAVSQAAVTLIIGVETFGPIETDPNGVSTIPVNANNANKAGTLKVVRTGFVTREKPVNIPLSSAAHSIYLDPVAFVVASSPVPPPPAEVSRVYSSGPQASGLGSEFSKWYELCSEPPPAGYVVRTAQFTLEGDRSCGAWSECKATSQTRDAVCWQFKLQGHKEWFPPRPAFTQGILRVSFGRS